jgi:hypothetical protein
LIVQLLDGWGGITIKPPSHKESAVYNKKAPGFTGAFFMGMR